MPSYHLKLPHEHSSVQQQQVSDNHGDALFPQHKWNRVKEALNKEPIHNLDALLDIIQETAYISERDHSSYVAKSRAGLQQKRRKEGCGNGNKRVDVSGLSAILNLWKREDSPEKAKWRVKCLQKIQKVALMIEKEFPLDLETGEVLAYLKISLMEELTIGGSASQQSHKPAKTLIHQSLTRAQIAVLLAQSFFCTMPFRSSWKRGGPLKDFQMVNFVVWYGKPSRNQVIPVLAQKLTFLMAYFDEVMQHEHLDTEWHKEEVTFSRQAVSPDYNFGAVEKNSLVSMKVVNGMGMEDYPAQDEYVSRVDFANQYIGGGVLEGGCVQEEIMFLIHPECLASLFFMKRMEYNEAIVIRGVKRFSNYKGYASSTQCLPLRDEQKKEIYSDSRPIEFLAIDAMSYNCRERNANDQYSKHHFWREIVKCHAGFLPVDEKSGTIATGNLGCGVFGGDPQFKMALQLLVASACERNLVYFPFNDKRMERLEEVYHVMKSKNVTVGDLLQMVHQYSRLKGRRENDKLGFFEFVGHAFRG